MNMKRITQIILITLLVVETFYANYRVRKLEEQAKLIHITMKCDQARSEALTALGDAVLELQDVSQQHTEIIGKLVQIDGDCMDRLDVVETACLILDDRTTKKKR